MDTSQEQHIDSLPSSNREYAYWQVAVFCTCRGKGLSRDDAAKKAGFNSAEDMYVRCKRWGLSGLLSESEGTVTPPRKRKARSAKGQRRELPPIKNAATIFRNTIATLEVYLEHVLSLKETRQGGYHFNEGETEEENIREARGGQWHPHPYLVVLIES